MLDLVLKENNFSAAVQFNVPQLDAAEFNPIASELKNLVTNFGGVLTPATDPAYLTDDTSQTSKTAVAVSGIVLDIDSMTSVLVTFTPAAAGTNIFPPIATMVGKTVRFRSTATNIGAYSVDWDTTIAPVLNEDGSILDALQIRDEQIIELKWTGSIWVLRAVIDQRNGGYLYGDGGVITKGASFEIDDFHSNEKNWQVGQKGFVSAANTGDVKLVYNAYRKAGAAIDDFEKVTSGWAGRLHFDEADKQIGIEYAPTGSPDSDFNFIRAWAVNSAGDFAIGENPDIHLPDGNASHEYEWYDNNRSIARVKGIVFSELDCINCYATSTLFEIKQVNAGNWYVVVRLSNGKDSYYSGSGAANDTHNLDSLVLVNELGPSTNFLKGPTGFGKTIPSSWENASRQQNRLGEYTSQQFALSGLFDDVLGHGFHTEAVANVFSIIDLDDLDTEVRGGMAIDPNTGTILVLGTTGVGGAATRCLRYPFGVALPTETVVLGAGDQATRLALDDKIGRYYALLNDLAAPPDGSIRYSDNEGATWTSSTTAITTDVPVEILVTADGTVVVLATFTNNIVAWTSIDNGVSFTRGTPLALGATLNLPTGLVEDTLTGNILAGTNGTGIVRSSDKGATWSVISAQVPDVTHLVEVFEGSKQVFYYGGDQGGGTTAKIFKSVNAGVTWVEVKSIAGGGFKKILVTASGVLYAVLKTSITVSSVYQSIDNGATWSLLVASSNSKDFNDAVMYAKTGQLYLSYSDIPGDLPSFEILNLEKDEANGTGTPLKNEFKNGRSDIQVADAEYSTGDTVGFDAPVLGLKRKSIDILKQPGIAISPIEAPLGSIFRNSLDGNYLYVKELDGAIHLLADELEPQLISAGAWTPDPANTNSDIVTLFQGGGAGATADDTLQFDDTGTDYYYFTTQAPVRWTSLKLQFRVTYITRAVFTSPANVRWKLGILRGLANGSVPLTWTALDVEQVVTTVQEWNRTVWSATLTMPAFNPLLDMLRLRMSRDNTVGSNMDIPIFFSALNIRFLPL